MFNVFWVPCRIIITILLLTTLQIAVNILNANLTLHVLKHSLKNTRMVILDTAVECTVKIRQSYPLVSLQSWGLGMCSMLFFSFASVCYHVVRAFFAKLAFFCHPQVCLMFLGRQWSNSTVQNAWMFTHQNHLDIITQMEHTLGQVSLTCCLWYILSTDQKDQTTSLFQGKVL